MNTLIKLWIVSVPYLVIVAGAALAVCCLCGLVGCDRLRGLK